MRALRTLAAAAAVSVAPLAPSTALADHIGVSIEAHSGDCGPLHISTNWFGEDGSHEEEARLVVFTANGIETARMGETLRIAPEDMAVPPTSTRPGEVRYRVWVGHEHYYANPAPYDEEALLAHLEAGGSPLEAGTPGVAWLAGTTAPCPEYGDPPAPEPTPSLPGPVPEPPPSHPEEPPSEPGPSPSPSQSPSPDPTRSPSPDPTGEPADWLAGLPSAPEGMKPGQWCRTEDRLTAVYAYTGTSALQCLDDNGWRWVEVHSPEDLVGPPPGDPTAAPTASPSPTRSPDPVPAGAAPPPSDSGRTLPVTGASLTALVLAAVVTATAGLVALWTARAGRRGPA